MKAFDKLPEEFQNSEVKYYYDILKKKQASLILKRALDILLAVVLLVFLILPIAVIAVAVRCGSEGPVLFRQERVTRYGRRFKILKFRTMVVDAERLGSMVTTDSDSRVTKIGRTLRKFRLDELPQIINIIRGDMSWVGPRPALWNQEDLIAERDKYGANDVMPGLTGWAQINGRDELEIPVKAKLDGEYVERMSFGFDIKCFVKTITSVLKHDGVVEGGTGEMKNQSKGSDK